MSYDRNTRREYEAHDVFFKYSFCSKEKYHKRAKFIFTFEDAMGFLSNGHKQGLPCLNCCEHKNINGLFQYQRTCFTENGISRLNPIFTIDKRLRK